MGASKTHLAYLRWLSAAGKKYCPRCQRELPKDCFGIRKTRLAPYCVECNRQYYKEYFRNRPKQEQQRRATQIAIHNSNKPLLLAYLAAHPCVDCGEKNPIVLQFDHRDPATKEFKIAAKFQVKPWSDLLLEIAKCDVRCANCHRIQTIRQHPCHWKLHYARS